MALNETIEIINATIAGEGVAAEGGNLIISRFVELITAPYHHSEMIWIVLPLIIGLFLMQLYFGRDKKEELGWNTAVGNSMALVFVSVDLIRRIYLSSASKEILDIVFDNFREILVVLFIALWGSWLLFGEFFHLFPKKFAFLASSSLPTTLIAYVGIVLIYTQIPLDFATVVASLILFIVLAGFFALIHFLEPISLGEK